MEAGTGIEPTVIRAGELDWDVGTLGDWRGEPVLLLHGFPEHWRTWALMMPALAQEGFRVHAACLPGYGDTTSPKSYDIDTVAGHLAELCRELGGGSSCHVVGHDWGGILAAAVAALHPDVVRSVTLTCCVHPAVFRSALGDPRQIARSWYVGMFQIPGIEHMLAKPAALDRMGPCVTEIETAEQMARAVAYYRANLRPWSLGGSKAGRISRPGLVVHAARDVAIGEPLMRRTAEQLDDLRGFEVLDRSHFIQRTAPDDFLAVLLPFLREVSR